MRLILINPKCPESFWTFKWAIGNVLPGKRAVNPPLGLATLAALCPPDWQVEIVDENIESVPLDPEADLIGVCGMGVQLARQRELLAYYRSCGHYVVAGGSYASLCPEAYADCADTVVAGEAEYIWKQFCADFAEDAAKPLYRETGTVDLADSPVPRFDLLKMQSYANATLQYSRGCPFRCEFCDIIVMFGRRPRVKTLDQIGRELDALRRQQVHSVFFVDDNLIGNPHQAKALLRFLAAYQAEHGYKFSFGTEASLNLAQDHELLDLFRAANFCWVFIGIESTDPASLKETQKTQNLREDILTSIRRIYSRGIDVLAGFIIGFDNDTVDTFEHQYRFITESGIQTAMIGLLTALPRTPLHERLEREGRLRPIEEVADNTRAMTNVVPKRMSLEAMADGYQALYARLLTSREIAKRIGNKMRYMRQPLYQAEYSLPEKLGIFSRLLWRGVVPGGFRQTLEFFRSMPLLAPSRLPLVISEWVVGLSMQQFARSHLDKPPPASSLESRVAMLRQAVAAYLAQGRITLSFRQPDLAISLEGLRDGRFFRAAAPHLRNLLKDGRARLIFRIERLDVQQAREFKRLLERLAGYGDRVFIEMDRSLGTLLAIDSSVFNLVLARSRPGT